MSDPAEVHCGGCQCGFIRYAIHGDPQTLYACHCRDCQKQSSSAFGLSLWAERDKFEITHGELKFWSTRADDGTVKLCAFCPECGTRIYHAIEGDDDVFSVKGGSLDNIAKFDPVAHIWTKRAHRWLDLEQKGTACYADEPVSFDEIVALFSPR